MKKYICFFILTKLIAFSPNLLFGQQLRIVSTSYDQRWQENTQVNTSRRARGNNPVVIRTDRTFQQIDGFGGSFNEMGWTALSYIPEQEREQVLKALFDQVEGCRFNICRMSIGANDFSHGYYSLNDTHFDYEMNHFTIDRDRQGVIPYIKMAMKFNPDVKIWGSPWTPPTWMKQSGHYGGRSINDNWGQLQGAPMEDITPRNRIRNDEKVFAAYADYFAKYVEAYREEGINVYAIHPQNEIFANQIFPSCQWDVEVMEAFMANHLIPRLQQIQPPVEVWMGTLNVDTMGYVTRLMANPAIAQKISGIGVQWRGLNMIDRLSENYGQNLRLMQTESECNNGSNDWFTAEHTYGLLIKAFNGGANSYMYWNMILDELGFSNWVWRQNSMISVNKFTREVHYNPEFYIMKHFSHFIDPGAFRIGLENADSRDIAFENPDGSVVVITANTSENEVSREFVMGRRTYQFTAKPKTVYTLKIGN
jgi:glucosylceramidase